MIKKKPFVPYRTENERSKDKRQVVPVSINNDEMQLFEACKPLLQQHKVSTLIKQLATIGARYIQRQETKALLEFVQANKRKNKRTGLEHFD